MMSFCFGPPRDLNCVLGLKATSERLLALIRQGTVHLSPNARRIKRPLRRSTPAPLGVTRPPSMPPGRRRPPCSMRPPRGHPGSSTCDRSRARFWRVRGGTALIRPATVLLCAACLPSASVGGRPSCMVTRRRTSHFPSTAADRTARRRTRTRWSAGFRPSSRYEFYGPGGGRTHPPGRRVWSRRHSSLR